MKGKENSPRSRSVRRNPRKISDTYLRNAGLFYLQRYSASTSHFRRIMIRKIDKSCRYHTDQNRRDCIEMLEKLVEDFSRTGLLNDGQYAQAQVSSLRRRGYGVKTILLKLKAKGLDTDLIRQSLEAEALDNDMNDFRAALRYIRRRRLGPFRIREPARPDDAALLRNKELAALARAGFGYDTAHKVLMMDRDEIEAFLRM